MIVWETLLYAIHVIYQLMKTKKKKKMNSSYESD